MQNVTRLSGCDQVAQLLDFEMRMYASKNSLMSIIPSLLISIFLAIAFICFSVMSLLVARFKICNRFSRITCGYG